MPKITFIDFQGTSRSVEAEQNQSIMAVATANLIPGIDGDCGGCAACGTCHVRVDPAWIGKLSPISDQEQAMLEVSPDISATSRLACRIVMTPQLDGIVVHTPEGQF